MSGKFSGFTEDDIKKAQNNLPRSKNATDTEKSVPRSKKSQKVLIRIDSARHKILESKTTNDASNYIPEKAKLSKPINTISDQTESECDNNIAQSKTEQVVAAEPHTTNEEAVIQESPNNNLEKRYIDLDEFQARQKVIEEQNNRRKELLAKALADRTKRTQEEAKRLDEIQGEFKKLDVILSNDVKILRKKIEAASLDYMEAQKRYLRIETLFLTAKLDLQKHLEKKEMLTEHLCTIIEQNEERKAEKLTELLNKLNIDAYGKEEVDEGKTTT